MTLAASNLQGYREHSLFMRGFNPPDALSIRKLEVRLTHSVIIRIAASVFSGCAGDLLIEKLVITLADDSCTFFHR